MANAVSRGDKCPLWSIGYEVFSYVLLAGFMVVWFLLPGARTVARGMAWWCAVLAAATGAHALLLWMGQTDDVSKGWQYGMSGGAKYWWPSYNPAGFFASFVIGVLAAGMSDALARLPHVRINARRWVFDLVVVLAIASIVGLLWSLRHSKDFAFSWPTQPYYFPTFPLLIGVVLALSPHTRKIGQMLDCRPARFVATISFGLYIWHYLILEAARVVWPDVKYFGVLSLTDWAYKIAVLYLLAVAVASVSWYQFERRVVAWSQRK